jgi:hypothetical protein
MKDRFTVGLISGVAAGIIGSLTNLFITQIVHFGSLRFIDFSAIFIYGRKPSGLAEDLFAWVGYLAFTAFLGIIFAYLIPLFSSQNFMLKATFFGIAVWFFCYAITFLFKIPHLTKISLSSALSNFIAASVFGLVLGWIYPRIWQGNRAPS